MDASQAITLNPYPIPKIEPTPLTPEQEVENEYAERMLLHKFRTEVSFARDALCEELKVEFELIRPFEERNLSPAQLVELFEEEPFEDLMLWHNYLRVRAFDLEWNKKCIHFQNSLSVDLSHDEACSIILRDHHIEALWDDIRCAYFGDDES